MSITSRAKAEGEALLKEMGFEDKETPGRRRTRAAIRGDVYTPPAKKERKSPAPGSEHDMNILYFYIHHFFFFQF